MPEQQADRAIPYADLREWIAGIDALGELKRIAGAHWDLELGAITEIVAQTSGGPALLFDDIPGSDHGYRVLANTLMSNDRIAYTFGARVGGSGLDLVRHWRDLLARTRTAIPPEVVQSGAVNENVVHGNDVDLQRFPSPRWHRHDGGRYIGTGCLVITKDPVSGWVNLGTYRVMLHDGQHVALYIGPGKHGRLIRDRYWAKNEPCPIAVCVGQDILLTALGGIEVAAGESEFDVAGGIRQQPVPVITSDVTGLPIPASAEIVLEGFLHHDQTELEGPFGEWTGYYAGERGPAPSFKVECLRHRNDPIMLGSLTGRPPSDSTYYRGMMRSALVWNQLEAAGVPGITGVWAHEAGGGRLWTTVSVQQRYAGHARQVGLVASSVHAAAFTNRFTVVVDDDIDVTNTNEVLWALCTRMDPRSDLMPIHGAWSSRLDPMAYPPEQPETNSRLVIDACIPWGRRQSFPRKVQLDDAERTRTLEKWSNVLGIPAH